MSVQTSPSSAAIKLWQVDHFISGLKILDFLRDATGTSQVPEAPIAVAELILREKVELAVGSERENLFFRHRKNVGGTEILYLVITEHN